MPRPVAPHHLRRLRMRQANAAPIAKSTGISASALRAAIDASGLSIAEVARRAGMRPPHLNRLLAGERPDIRVSTAAALAGVLTLSTGYRVTMESLMA